MKYELGVKEKINKQLELSKQDSEINLQNSSY